MPRQDGKKNVTLKAYFIADWEHWLGDWEHLKPMMQQLHSFLLFRCCNNNSIRAILKPSYVSKYMLKRKPSFKTVSEHCKCPVVDEQLPRHETSRDTSDMILRGKQTALVLYATFTLFWSYLYHVIRQGGLRQWNIGRAGPTVLPTLVCSILHGNIKSDQGGTKLWNNHCNFVLPLVWFFQGPLADMDYALLFCNYNHGSSLKIENFQTG